MARYIDADKLFRYVDEQSRLSKGKLEQYIRENCTTEVEEVRRGRWLDDIKEITPLNASRKIEALVGCRCSECNRYELSREPYCNCGAKMDGGKAE